MEVYTVQVLFSQCILYINFWEIGYGVNGQPLGPVIGSNGYTTKCYFGLQS